MKPFRRTTEASRREATELLSRIEWVARDREFAAKRKEVKARMDALRTTPRQEAETLIKQYGIPATIKAAWTMFSDATKPDRQQFWKKVYDHASEAKSKRGF